jgi:uncharacterized protein YbjQ (UPF0145 family)
VGLPIGPVLLSIDPTAATFGRAPHLWLRDGTRHFGIRNARGKVRMMVFGPSDSSDAMSDQSPHYGEAGGSQFPITTTLVFPDRDIDHSLGMVFGVVVRSMGIARNIGAGFKSLAGGEVKQYTRLVEDSRRHALDRMIENAQLIGGEGIISMRFDSSEVGNTLTEIVAYGTVVTFRKSE